VVKFPAFYEGSVHKEKSCEIMGWLLTKIADMKAHGRGVRWPIHNSTRRLLFMEGWCNGTAGHVLLLALADQVLEPGAYAGLAERGAQSMWETQIELGTLCCGLGGLGYALLSVYRLTDDEVWLQRARAIAHRAATDASGEEFRESLYKGALGAAVLVEELKEPRLAAMPFFEPTAL
jgi:eukaryotic-like serine/threonine-protein kinase